MATGTLKVLVTGSVNSQFSAFFDKISNINSKHGPFDLVLCTGDFFASDDALPDVQALLQGNIQAPVSTYFIQGGQRLPEAVQQHLESNQDTVCENVMYLGSKGIMTTAEGLKIAYLSGNGAGDDASALTYDADAVQKLRTSKHAPHGVDLLLTAEWPLGVQQGSANTPSSSLKTASRAIAQLALGLKPRYHFADSEAIFYEREPYTNIVGFGDKDEQPASHVTRFIGLGHALNKDKQRWFYAYNMVPMSKATPDVLTAHPTLTTDAPFWEITQAGRDRKRGPADDSNGSFFWGDAGQPAKKRAPPPNYVCKKCNVPGHFIQDCPENQQQQQQQRRGPPDSYVCKICNTPGHWLQNCPQRTVPNLSECWFCLSNPNIEKHLITSIGNEIYMTLAKGPLVAPETCNIPGGGHVLLIAINHYPAFGRVPPENVDAVHAELNQYKDALRNLFNKHGHDMVVYEIAREAQRGLSHAHLQIVAVPKGSSDNIEAIVQDEAAKTGYALQNERSDSDRDYFDMELPNGKHLIHLLHPKTRFNLQFGRQTLARALGQDDRADWKNCKQETDDEKQAGKAFKGAFKPFDFTL